MKTWLEKSSRFFDQSLDGGPRGVLVAAAVLLLAAYLFPLWNMTMFAPQYPDGLRLHIYSYKLEAGNAGQDLNEINILNHYIGMRDLTVSDFTEFKWIPFVVGLMGILFLRAAVLGKMAHLVDVLVLYLYFGVFSVWSFGYKLYRYGHDLAPTASVKVAPFMPPMFGHKKLANFDVYSFPALGSYVLAAVAIALVAAALLHWRAFRNVRAEEK